MTNTDYFRKTARRLFCDDTKSNEKAKYLYILLVRRLIIYIYIYIYIYVYYITNNAINGESIILRDTSKFVRV